MTPQQRLQLFAARTADTGAELAAWLRDHAQVLSRPARGLDIDIDAAVRELLLLKAAVDQPPALGVIGTGATGRLGLVLDLLKPRAPAATADTVGIGFPGLPNAFDLAQHILPPERERTACLTYRDSTDDRCPPGHPIRLGLLNELDIVRILAGIHLSQTNTGLESLTLVARLDELFADATTRLLPSSMPGLGPHDVRDVSEYVARGFPEHPLPQILTAAGYWDRLGAIATYLPSNERQRLLAVLWGEDSGLTLLFTSLANGLDKLSHATEVYAVLDALIRRDATSGWFQPHPESVLALSTVNRIGTSGVSPDESVSVARRTGTALEIDRPIIAALLADVSLRIATPTLVAAASHTVNERIDIVDFPSAQPLSGSAIGRARPQLSLAEAVTLYNHAKISYLFARAVERHTLTSVLVPIDGASLDTPGDISWRDGLENWIDRAQGADATARERFKPGLFFAVLMPTASDAPPASPRGDVDPPLEALFGETPPWLSQWTPDLALPTTFRISQQPTLHRQAPRATPPLPSLNPRPDPYPSSYPSTANPWPQPSQASLPATDATQWQPSTRQWSATEQLIAQIQSSTNAQARLRQLTDALAVIRRRLKQRLQRFNVSSDPLVVAEWRRQAANVAAQRLGAISRSGQLARLEALIVPPTDILATVARNTFREDETNVIAATDTSRELAVPHGHGLPAVIAPTQDTQDNLADRTDRAGRTADRLLTYWLLHMRQLARSSVLARSLRLPQSALEVLVDELALSSERAGLAADLTSLMRRTGALSDPEPKRALRIGTLAQRVMAIHFETLGPRLGRVDTTAGQRIVTRQPNFGSTGNERLDWCEAIGNIADSNSVSAQIFAGALGHDRELAELVASLSASSFEGEP